MSNNISTQKEILELKRLASGIIRTQGNKFIKKLLHLKGIPIGTNKKDFEKNLINAIESSKLRLEDVDSWLKKVEGWGDQHVYLYTLSDELTDNLSEQNIFQKVKDAGLETLLNGETILEFPEKPTLTSITFKNSVLSLIWQESTPGWNPVPDKNYKKKDGLDTYEYRAWLKTEHRVINRFEAHIEKGLAALFIPHPIQGKEHDESVQMAKETIDLLMNFSLLEDGQINISDVSRNLDQQNIPSNSNPNPDIKTQKSKLSSGGAYIEFAANSRDKAYSDESAILDVRKSVRQQQLPLFQGRSGVFIFQENTSLELKRPLRVQLYGKEKRIRLWAQMASEEVWKILNKLSEYQ